MQYYMLISDLLKKLQKKCMQKSYEQNSQLKVHFLGFNPLRPNPSFADF